VINFRPPQDAVYFYLTVMLLILVALVILIAVAAGIEATAAAPFV
jgi:hypothetical protein